MNTLNEVKKRVRMQLGVYSENGGAISSDDTILADMDLRFNNAVDVTQRKIFVTGRKTTVKIPVMLRKPLVAAEQNDDDIFIIEENSAAVIYIPKAARNFSFKIDTDLNSVISCEVYSAASMPSYAVCGMPYDDNGECSEYTKLESCWFKSEPAFSPTQICGFLNGAKESDSFYALKITTDSRYIAVISDFAGYITFYSEKEKIPEKGFINALLPGDIIEIKNVEKASGGGKLTEVRGGNLDFRLEQNLLCAPVCDDGLYYVTYTKYPARIPLDANGDEVLELNDFEIDALVFGVAAMLCPEDNTAVYAKMNVLFEEAMRNLYNVNDEITGVVNKVYRSVKRAI